MKNILGITILLTVFISTTVVAVTWLPKEVKCPLCETDNEFVTWGSYGSYVNDNPSRYQLVFWPRTSSNVLYSCKKCKLTTYMWDFESIPEDKYEEIKKALKDVKLDVKKNYAETPMLDRIAVAEKVYKITKPDDDFFWNDFYRFKAYYVDMTDTDKAKEYRLKSLEHVEKLLKDEKNKDIKKEILLSKGAMLYFTSRPVEALKIFNEAKKEEYKDAELEKKEIERINKNLNAFIDEYVKKITKIANAKMIVDKLIEQEWFTNAVKAVELEKDEKLKVLLPKSLLKDGIDVKRPISLKLNGKEVKVSVGSSEKSDKKLINFTKFTVEDKKAEITLIICGTEPKDLTFTKEKDIWSIAKAEKESK